MMYNIITSGIAAQSSCSRNPKTFRKDTPMSETTKWALANSLKDLLQTRNLDRITVSDITDACGVNRMTFYYHFQDIYDLIDWMLLHDADRVLGGKKTYETWQQGFLRIFNACLDNKAFIMNVYHSISHDKLEEYLYRLTYDLLIGVVNEKSAGINVREDDKNFIANFYKYAFVGIMLDWINSGMMESPDRIIDRISTLIYGDITQALNKYKYS
jgi:probable dihydroxyacetone kinase regulator